jgi:hypothetical protein
MKLLLYFFFSVVLFTASAQDQLVPKGATAIEVTTTLAGSALFESVQAYLEDAGFDIDEANEDEESIVTEYKVVSEFGAIKEPVQIRILAHIEEGVVLFKGETLSSATGRSSRSNPVMNTLGVDGAANGEFSLMNEVITRYAKTLDQATIEYNVP